MSRIFPSLLLGAESRRLVPSFVSKVTYFSLTDGAQVGEYDLQLFYIKIIVRNSLLCDIVRKSFVTGQTATSKVLCAESLTATFTYRASSKEKRSPRMDSPSEGHR